MEEHLWDGFERSSSFRIVLFHFEAHCVHFRQTCFIHSFLHPLTDDILCLLLLYLVTFNSNIILHLSEYHLSSFKRKKKKAKKNVLKFANHTFIFLYIFWNTELLLKEMKCYSLVQDILCQCSIDTAAWNIFHAFC